MTEKKWHKKLQTLCSLNKQKTTLDMTNGPIVSNDDWKKIKLNEKLAHETDLLFG